MTVDVLKDIERHLQNLEYRQAYGDATIKYDLAGTLVDARRQADLTQEKLAELLGVTQEYVAKLESGNANPTIGRVGALLATIWLRMQFRLAPLVHWSEPGPRHPEDSKVVSSASGYQISEGLARSRPGAGTADETSMMTCILPAQLNQAVTTLVLPTGPWGEFSICSGTTT